MVGRSKPHLRSAFQLICVSLSKADAKLLLYNISAKYFKHFFSNSCNFFAKSLIQRCVFQHKNITVSRHSITAIPYYLRTRAMHTSKQGKSFLTPDRWMPALRYVHPTFGYPEGLQRPFLKTPWRLRENVKAFWLKWLDVLTRSTKHIPIRLDKLNYTLSLIDMRESSNFAIR